MTKQSSTKPFIPYVRISRLNGRERGANVSYEEQVRSIQTTAARYELKLGDVISDEDVSGWTFDRPGWNRAMDAIEADQAAGVVAFDLKRMSRGKTAEVLAMVEDVEASGGQLYDETGRVSVADTDAEMITTLKAAMNRRETRERAAYIARNVRNAIERGVHLDATYGYMRSNGKGSRLAVNPDEAPAVRQAFELRADGHSWPAVAAALNASGVRPRPYKRHGVVKQAVWTHKTVRQLVRNEVYIGTAYNGEHRTPGAHPAIVDLELFARANRARGVKPQGPSDGYPLTGLPRCSGCGYVMLHSVERGRRYYRCKPGQHGAGKCPAPANVPAADLETHVLEQFKDRFIDVEMEPAAADDALGQALEQEAKGKARVGRAQKLVIAAESDEERESAEELLAGERLALREATDAVRAARQQVHGVNLDPNLDEDAFDNLPVPDQRRLLGEAFAAVVVWPAQVWREPAAERSRILTRDEAPSSSTALIARVAGIRR